MIRIHKTSWQTMIRIRRTKLGRANSKIRMEPVKRDKAIQLGSIL